MKNYLFLLSFFFCSIKPLLAQDSTLVGHFSLGLMGQYNSVVPLETETYRSTEKGLGGYKLFMKYYKNSRWVLLMAFQSVRSSENRLNKNSFAKLTSYTWGLEHHIPVGNFSPFIGFEGGFSFHNYKSHLIKMPQNITYFINNFPLAAARPKVGFSYLIVRNISINAEYSYNLNFSFDKASRNPLFDENNNELYFSRKSHGLSIGVAYKFK